MGAWHRAGLLFVPMNCSLRLFAPLLILFVSRGGACRRFVGEGRWRACEWVVDRAGGSLAMAFTTLVVRIIHDSERERERERERESVISVSMVRDINNIVVSYGCQRLLSAGQVGVCSSWRAASRHHPS